MENNDKDEIILIKFGGVCLTNKNKIHTLDYDNISWSINIISELYKNKKNKIILVHGAV
jgi:isopentenyl phosphate kinase